MVVIGAVCGRINKNVKDAGYQETIYFLIHMKYPCATLDRFVDAFLSSAGACCGS